MTVQNTEPKAPKTPWNPSRRATARVLNPLPAPTVCPHCGNRVELVNNEAIYGKSYGEWPWAYRCATGKACDSFVGMHPYTNIPLGTLATPEMRNARKLTKDLFQQTWGGKDSGRMSRDDAYAWLASQLNIPLGECHFGWFDIPTCRKAYAILRTKLSPVQTA